MVSKLVMHETQLFCNVIDVLDNAYSATSITLSLGNWIQDGNW